MKITRSDVIDALNRAQRLGLNLRPDPASSWASMFKDVMQACDDAEQASLLRHSFVLCACCSHPGKIKTHFGEVARFE